MIKSTSLGESKNHLLKRFYNKRSILLFCCKQNCEIYCVQVGFPIELILALEDLLFIKTDVHSVFDQGEFEIVIGSSSKDLNITSEFTKQ